MKYSVIFCENQEVINELLEHEPAINHEIEAVQRGTHVMYRRVPKGNTLDTPFSKIMSKPTYKATTTNRNINTLKKML